MKKVTRFVLIRHYQTSSTKKEPVIETDPEFIELFSLLYLPKYFGRPQYKRIEELGHSLEKYGRQLTDTEMPVIQSESQRGKHVGEELVKRY